jgi:hypothetical protein
MHVKQFMANQCELRIRLTPVRLSQLMTYDL